MNSKTTPYTSHTFTTTNAFLQHYKNDQNPTRPNHVLYMYVTPKELQNVPASFFMVKELTRQSSRPGTIVFKYLRLDLTGTLKFPSKDIPAELADKVKEDTDLDQLKNVIINLVARNENARIQFEFSVQGSFANLETPNDPYEKQYLIYDVDQFPTTLGAPTWFLKRGTEFKVTATGNYSKKYNRDYYQIAISTDATAEEAFSTGATRGATPHFDTASTSADAFGAETAVEENTANADLSNNLGDFL